MLGFVSHPYVKEKQNSDAAETNLQIFTEHIITARQLLGNYKGKHVSNNSVLTTVPKDRHQIQYAHYNRAQSAVRVLVLSSYH